MNILNFQPSGQVISVVAGIITLLLFALAIALPGSKTTPGQKSYRPTGEDTGNEEIRGDDFIDSFNGEIEEAGSGMPLVVKLALPGVLLWWLIYLIINWSQP